MDLHDTNDLRKNHYTKNYGAVHFNIGYRLGNIVLVVPSSRGPLSDSSFVN